MPTSFGMRTGRPGVSKMRGADDRKMLVNSSGWTSR